MYRRRISSAACRSCNRPSTRAGRETSSKVVTTRSAPASANCCWSPRRATPIAAKPPALAACTPLVASSTTKHTSGRKSEFLRSGQEDHRVGFAAGEVAAGDVGIEQLLQGHPTVYEAIGEALFGSEGVESNPFE